MNLAVRALTPELWPALTDLFGEQGARSGCWCMYFRIGSAYRRRSSSTNKAAFHKVVSQGPAPGLLAFDGERAVGWCQVTPRSRLPWLDRTWRLKAVDDVPVWSISCFYIRIGYRRRGVMGALIRAALDLARQAGAPALEAYPLDGQLSPSATSTGYVSAFVRAGFKEVIRRSPERPIMRYEF